MSFSEQQVDILTDEQANDPLTRGYSGMSDQQFADSLNAKDIDVIKSTVSGSDVFAATVDTEYDALTAGLRQEWLSLCAIDSLVPSNGEAAASTVIRIFGGGSATIANLQTLRTSTISRGSQLGLPVISLSHISRIT